MSMTGRLNDEWMEAQREDEERERTEDEFERENEA